MILVVDDFPDSAEAFARLLRKVGYPAEAVFSGADALARVRAHPPEQPLLVVLDEMMPHLSGMDVLRTMRGEPTIAATPVVFFTAGFDTLKRDEAITLGALAWLYKGSTPDVQMILSEIARLYESVGGAKCAAAAADAPTPRPPSQ
jgi:CheY-like chemotaxis protein